MAAIPGDCQLLVLFLLFLVRVSVESPLQLLPLEGATSTALPESPDPAAGGGGSEANDKNSVTKGGFRPNAEISYFWHQKGRDFMPIWPLESPTTSKGDRVLVIHRISDDFSDSGIKNRNDPNVITGFGNSGRGDKAPSSDDYNNIFVFCLMFLFGLIICGLMWCLCTVSRHQVDNNGEPYSSRRMNSRFGSRRRANIEVLSPYSRDLPPSYDDIVADFEKLGSQCILPSYKDIMSKRGSSDSLTGRQHRPTASPPPRYTSPTGSFSAQGDYNNSIEVNRTNSANSTSSAKA